MLLRASSPEDLESLRAFVHRCSPETLYRRFHGAGGRAIERELGRVASSTVDHRSWVALADGEVRGTATLARSRTGASEMAVLVEDDNEPALRFIRAVAPGASVRFVGGAELEIQVPVPVPAAAAGPSERTREAAWGPDAAPMSVCW